MGDNIADILIAARSLFVLYDRRCSGTPFITMTPARTSRAFAALHRCSGRTSGLSRVCQVVAPNIVDVLGTQLRMAAHR
jgi:hypothetical protein